MPTIAVWFSFRTQFILITICFKNILYRRIYPLSLRFSFRGEKWDFICWKSITVWRNYGQTVCWDLFDISKMIYVFQGIFFGMYLFPFLLLYYSRIYFCFRFSFIFSNPPYPLPLHYRYSSVIIIFSSSHLSLIEQKLKKKGRSHSLKVTKAHIDLIFDRRIDLTVNLPPWTNEHRVTHKDGTKVKFL